jgi:hypothetical protein
MAAGQYPTDFLAQEMAGMNMQTITRAGESPLMALFGAGNLIMLWSCATERYVRVYNGEVQGTGDPGPFGSFRVHVVGPGVVKLQVFNNEPNSLDWLSIYQGNAIGHGRGGDFCEFKIVEIGNAVMLESTQYPGERLGFRPDGCILPPNFSNEDDRADKFIPQVYQYAPPPPQASYAAPQQSYAQQPPPQGYGQPGYYPPPAGYYGQPQGSMMPPPQGSMMPPPQGSMMPPPQGSMMPPPQGSMMPPPQLPPSVYPQGFSIDDAFRGGNVIQLISKSSGDLLNIEKGNLACKGKYGAPDAQWTVTIASNQDIILTNVHWPGSHAGIKGKHATAISGKIDKNCQLKHHVLSSNNYVYFESNENPGYFLGFNHKGEARKASEVKDHEEDVQFFVRMERQKHPYCNAILGVNNLPSTLFSRVTDRSIVQFHAGQNRYMSIDPKGNVVTISDPNSENTFFIWKDRGMGIVSLQSHKSPGYRVRMTNFVVVGKGEPDINGDFRVKENGDGTISLESVSCQGGFLAVDVNKAAVNHLHVNMVVIQKFGKSNTVTK